MGKPPSLRPLQLLIHPSLEADGVESQFHPLSAAAGTTTITKSSLCTRLEYFSILWATTSKISARGLQLSSPFPKHAQQIRNPCQKQASGNSNVCPRDRIPAPWIDEIRKLHDMVGHGQMANICNRTGDQKVPDNFWLGRCVEHGDSNETEEAVDVAELKGQDVRGSGQGDWNHMWELRGGEGGRVTSNGHVGDDSGCEISQGKDERVAIRRSRLGNTRLEVRRR